jgi:hypothetical protein
MNWKISVATILLVLVAVSCIASVRAILGDVNGDGKADMKDVSLVIKAFRSSPSDPRYNPSCDLNSDGQIDMRDVIIVVMNFGKS